MEMDNKNIIIIIIIIIGGVKNEWIQRDGNRVNS